VTTNCSKTNLLGLLDPRKIEFKELIDLIKKDEINLIEKYTNKLNSIILKS